MKGYVARKGDRWYAVVYEGIDPVTGRERRTWHAARTDRADAERLAARLAAERNGRNDESRSLTFGAFLTRRWLPGKRVVLATSTYAGYRRNSSGTSFRLSGGSACGGFDPITSKRSTEVSCTPAKGAQRLLLRPSTRSTWSFVARCRTRSAAGS
jgi:hypothetical protein